MTGLRGAVKAKKFDVNSNAVPFDLREYLNKRGFVENKLVRVNYKEKTNDFYKVCDIIEKYYNEKFKEETDIDVETNIDEIIKKATIGHEKEVKYLMNLIKEYIYENGIQNVEYDKNVYSTLEEAVFHYIWGYYGIVNWIKDKESSSCKITRKGKMISYLIDGKMEIQNHNITEKTFTRLRGNLLNLFPELRKDEDVLELYMLNGIRVEIITGDIVKNGQDAMVFRKYVVKDFTFREQANRGTITDEMIPLLESFSRCGFNVAVTGAPRTAKTTILTTMQVLEDPTLEGVIIETDPEIPYHNLMPDTSLLQLIVNSREKAELALKTVLRLDPDYIVVTEAREADVLNLAIETANKGTTRGKLSYHIRKPETFFYDVSNRIVQKYKGEIKYILSRVANSFHFIVHMIMLKDKSKKRLGGIYAVINDSNENTIYFNTLCKYNHKTDSWTFNSDIPKECEEVAEVENPDAFMIFKETLEDLAKKFPMKGESVIRPSYYNILND
jgi:pilus assembly protein CpaF